MHRRDALKTLGFGSTALFSSSALLGALQGCTAVRMADESPSFLNDRESSQLVKICEGILPRTETPGATDAGVAQHLDTALANIYRDREAEYFRRGIAVFVERFEADLGLSFDAAGQNQITDRINGYLKRYSNDPAILKAFRASAEVDGVKSDDFIETNFVTNVVNATFASYFTSELAGETVMRYDPVPGKYEACIPYRKGQKSWASV